MPVYIWICVLLYIYIDVVFLTSIGGADSIEKVIYVYVYGYLYIYVYSRLHLYIMYTDLYIYIYLFGCLYIYMYVYILICAYLNVVFLQIK
jgi:hypothetical protein